MVTLVVTSSWPRTRDELAGTFVRTDALVRAASSRVVVAAPEGPGIARGGEGLTVIDVPHGGLFGSPGAATRLRERPTRARGLPVFARAVARLAAEVEPSRIVAHWLLPSGALAARLGRPVEAIAHGGDVRLLEAMPRALARAFLHRLAGRASLRAVSTGLAARLRAIAPALSLSVEPMPLAAASELAAAREAARALRATHGDRLCVVAARLVPEKRIERVLPLVRGRRLVLVGDGPARAALVERARRASVDVLSVGAVAHEQALAWLAAASEVLAPLARGEGAPTVVREAEALGVPVTVL